MTKLKWCIKRTEDNYKEVNEWVKKSKLSFGDFRNGDIYVYSELVLSSNWTIKSSDFHEITIDEFRLLTDPEKYRDRVFEEYGNVGLCWSFTNDEGERASCSAAVFSELQRMFMERESEKTGRCEPIKSESTGIYQSMLSEDGSKIIHQRLLDGHWVNVDDSERIYEIEKRHKFEDFVMWELERQSKLLKKIDKKLTKLIKKQNPKRHEKTIM